MKEKMTLARTSLQITAGIARLADRILTTFLVIVLIMIFLYSCFAIWDTWRIYDAAGLDQTLLKYKPELNQDNEESFDELMAINPDVCAWLTIENTNIDYPVLQGKDNVTYVNTNVYGEFSLSGSIFLDYRNSRDFTDSYNLIYGHHMEKDLMFGELDSFQEKKFFNEHASGILYLPDRNLQIDIFACIQTDSYDKHIFGAGNLTENEMEILLDMVKNSALQYRDIGINANNQIIALSTCSNATTNGRTVVLGRLEEIANEKERR